MDIKGTCIPWPILALTTTGSLEFVTGALVTLCLGLGLPGREIQVTPFLQADTYYPSSQDRHKKWGKKEKKETNTVPY